MGEYWSNATAIAAVMITDSVIFAFLFFEDFFNEVINVSSSCFYVCLESLSQFLN